MQQRRWLMPVWIRWLSISRALCLASHEHVSRTCERVGGRSGRVRQLDDVTICGRRDRRSNAAAPGARVDHGARITSPKRLQAETAMIETIQNAAGFQELRGEWGELLQASASNSLFLTWEWLYPWWKHLSGDRTLSIVTMR